jgi:hypothetical protein
MALSESSTQQVKHIFNQIFPGKKITETDKKVDGGAESISVNVEKIDKYQLKSLATLAGDISNSFLMKRSGTGMTVAFY